LIRSKRCGRARQPLQRRYGRWSEWAPFGAARAKGAERYEGFLQALGRRLAKGPGFIREVSLDIGSPVSTQSENDKELTQGSE